MYSPSRGDDGRRQSTVFFCGWPRNEPLPIADTVMPTISAAAGKLQPMDAASWRDQLGMGSSCIGMGDADWILGRAARP